MARKASVGYYASRGGYCCWWKGTLKVLAKGPRDEPDGPTYTAAKEEFRRLEFGTIFGPTLGQIIEQYLAWYRGHVALPTYKSAKSALGSIQKGLGMQYAYQLTAGQVEMWCDQQRHKGRWGDGMVSFSLRKIQECMLWAVEERLLKAMPWRKLKKPREPARSLECVLDEAQERRVMEEATGGLRDLLVVLRDTGCRPGEASKAEARHYDPHRKAIVLPAVDGGKPGHKTAKKTGKPRVIYLRGEALSLVQRLIRERPSGPLLRRRAWRRKSKGEKIGKRWTDNGICIRITKLRERVNVPCLVAYSFRHTFAVRRLREGMSADVLAAMLGTSRTMIERHYGHLTEQHDFLRKAADGIPPSPSEQPPKA